MDTPQALVLHPVGKVGEGLLTGPANMLSYYNARHWAEGVKVALLYSSQRATLWGRRFWPHGFQMRKVKPRKMKEHAKGTPQADCRAHTPVLCWGLSKVESWAEGGTEVRGQGSLSSGTPHRKEARVPAGFLMEGQFRPLLSCGVHASPLRFVFYRLCFLKMWPGLLSMLSRAAGNALNGPVPASFFWRFKKDLAKSPIFSPTEKEKWFYTVTLLLVKEIGKQ